MKNLLFLIVFLFLVTAEARRPRPDFVAPHSTEAQVLFDHWVLIEGNQRPTMAQAREQVDEQVAHLFGPWSVFDEPAVPKDDYKVQIKSIARAEGNQYRIEYSYKGWAQVWKGPRTRLRVILPLNPDTIYEQSAVQSRGKVYYPCTDEHYDAEGDFWYFWNPLNEGCRLKAGENYSDFYARLERVPNVPRSVYPEYDRLADSEGRVRIDVFVGLDEATNSWNPEKSDDVAAGNYLELRESLIRMGFSARRLLRSELVDMVGRLDSQKTPWVEEYEKNLGEGGRAEQIQIRLFFGPTGIDERSKVFHHLLADSLQNASILIYNGHSGLGGNLDLEGIEEKRGISLPLNKKRYQIFFFNSCSSYPYYNKIYFQRKKSASDPEGTKNLDIMTNGLLTDFQPNKATDLPLIRAVLLWAKSYEISRKTQARLSFQALGKSIDTENLFGINGVGDNPTRLPR